MATYQRNTIHTIDDIIAIADHAGSHFFSRDTMRFFSSRVLSGIYAPDGYEAREGRRFFFVTSERHGDDAPRHYAVRMMTLGAQRDDRAAVDIVTVGDYHSTANAAHKAAQCEADAIRYGVPA
jgi:hypothetical protein